MRLAALFSGGKDSTYAIYLAKKEGHEVKYLLTVLPPSTESWMFHYPCVEMTEVQAELMGIKHLTTKTKGKKENELEDLKTLIRKIRGEIDGILSGGIASNYQKERIDKICKEFDLQHVSPLWGKNREKSLREEIENGFEIIISGVAAQGMDESWLGRKIDLNVLNELKTLVEKFKIDIGGEGGEYETLVLDCPLFKERIVLKKYEKVWDEKTNSGYIKIKDFKLERKY